MTSFIQHVVNAAVPVTKLIGDIGLPESLVTGKDYYSGFQHLKPGYGIISKNKYHLSNILIPGFWKHVGVYDPRDSQILDEIVIEAVGKHGVHEISLVDFFLTKDFVAVIKPKFLSDEQLVKVAETTRQWVGLPYDYRVLATNLHALYCAKLYWLAIRDVLGKDPFPMVNRIGTLTVAPQDFMDRPDLFEVVYVSQSYQLFNLKN